MDILKLFKILGLDPANAKHKAIIDKATGEKPELTDADINAISLITKEKWKPIHKEEFKNDQEFVKEIQAKVYPDTTKKALEDIGTKLKAHGIKGEFKNTAELANTIGEFVKQNKAKTPEEIAAAVEAAKTQYQTQLATEVGKAQTDAQAKADARVLQVQQGHSLHSFFGRFMNEATKDDKGVETNYKPSTNPSYINFSQVVENSGLKPHFVGANFMGFKNADGTDLVDDAGNPITNPKAIAALKFGDLRSASTPAPATPPKVKVTGSQLGNPPSAETAARASFDAKIAARQAK